jgi:hypothetical protein
MLDEDVGRVPDPSGDGLWRRLRDLPPEPVPEGLLERCMEAAAGPAFVRPITSRRTWIRSIGVAAAALLAVGVAALAIRPGDAEASQFLRAAGVTWSEITACHSTMTLTSDDGQARTVEVWYARDKGGREETRRGGELIGVVVANDRWEFRWDVPGKVVAAWSRKLLGRQSAFEGAGRVLACDAVLAWAEKNRAEIKIEADSLDGVAVRKVTLRWPVVEGSPPQVDTFWFEPESLRPVRQHSLLPDGGSIESRLDYPAPENIPADLLAFRPPAGAVLEVNDPELGRQVYSEGRPDESNLESNPTNGEKP